VPGDIEAVFGEEFEIFEHAGTDYRFRVYVPKGRFIREMTTQMENIDYSNFKDSIEPTDHMRKKAYTNVWCDMYDYQDALDPHVLEEVDEVEYTSWWRRHMSQGFNKYLKDTSADTKFDPQEMDDINEYYNEETNEYFSEIEQKWVQATEPQV